MTDLCIMCQRERRRTLNNRQSHAMKLNKKYSICESLQRRKSLTPKMNNTLNDYFIKLLWKLLPRLENFVSSYSRLKLTSMFSIYDFAFSQERLIKTHEKDTKNSQTGVKKPILITLRLAWHLWWMQLLKQKEFELTESKLNTETIWKTWRTTMDEHWISKRINWTTAN